MNHRDPETPDEWQVAVNAAEAGLLLESARLYGLVVGGPGVNVTRCELLLEQGRARQIVPTKAGVDAAIQALVDTAALPRGTPDSVGPVGLSDPVGASPHE